MIKYILGELLRQRRDIKKISKLYKSKQGLTVEQTKELIKYIVEGDYGTFRVLIYHHLGLPYSDAYDMGLMSLNNWLHEMKQ